MSQKNSGSFFDAIKSFAKNIGSRPRKAPEWVKQYDSYTYDYDWRDVDALPLHEKYDRLLKIESYLTADGVRNNLTKQYVSASDLPKEMLEMREDALTHAREWIDELRDDFGLMTSENYNLSAIELYTGTSPRYRADIENLSPERLNQKIEQANIELLKRWSMASENAKKTFILPTEHKDQTQTDFEITPDYKYTPESTDAFNYGENFYYRYRYHGGDDYISNRAGEIIDPLMDKYELFNYGAYTGQAMVDETSKVYDYLLEHGLPISQSRAENFRNANQHKIDMRAPKKKTPNKPTPTSTSAPNKPQSSPSSSYDPLDKREIELFKYDSDTRTIVKATKEEALFRGRALGDGTHEIEPLNKSTPAGIANEVFDISDVQAIDFENPDLAFSLSGRLDSKTIIDSNSGEIISKGRAKGANIARRISSNSNLTGGLSKNKKTYVSDPRYYFERYFGDIRSGDIQHEDDLVKAMYFGYDPEKSDFHIEGLDNTSKDFFLEIVHELDADKSTEHINDRLWKKRNELESTVERPGDIARLRSDEKMFPKIANALESSGDTVHIGRQSYTKAELNEILESMNPGHKVYFNDWMRKNKPEHSYTRSLQPKQQELDISITQPVPDSKPPISQLNATKVPPSSPSPPPATKHEPAMPTSSAKLTEEERQIILLGNECRFSHERPFTYATPEIRKTILDPFEAVQRKYGANHPEIKELQTRAFRNARNKTYELYQRVPMEGDKDYVSVPEEVPQAVSGKKEIGASDVPGVNEARGINPVDLTRNRKPTTRLVPTAHEDAEKIANSSNISANKPNKSTKQPSSDPYWDSMLSDAEEMHSKYDLSNEDVSLNEMSPKPATTGGTTKSKTIGPDVNKAKDVKKATKLAGDASGKKQEEVKISSKKTDSSGERIEAERKKAEGGKQGKAENNANRQPTSPAADDIKAKVAELDRKRALFNLETDIKGLREAGISDDLIEKVINKNRNSLLSEDDIRNALKKQAPANDHHSSTEDMAKKERDLSKKASSASVSPEPVTTGNNTDNIVNPHATAPNVNPQQDINNAERVASGEQHTVNPDIPSSQGAKSASQHAASDSANASKEAIILNPEDYNKINKLRDIRRRRDSIDVGFGSGLAEEAAYQELNDEFISASSGLSGSFASLASNDHPINYRTLISKEKAARVGIVKKHIESNIPVSAEELWKNTDYTSESLSEISETIQAEQELREQLTKSFQVQNPDEAWDLYDGSASSLARIKKAERAAAAAEAEVESIMQLARATSGKGELEEALHGMNLGIASGTLSSTDAMHEYANVINAARDSGIFSKDDYDAIDQVIDPIFPNINNYATNQRSIHRAETKPVVETASHVTPVNQNASVNAESHGLKAVKKDSLRFNLGVGAALGSAMGFAIAGSHNLINEDEDEDWSKSKGSIMGAFVGAAANSRGHVTRMVSSMTSGKARQSSQAYKLLSNIFRSL